MALNDPPVYAVKVPSESDARVRLRDLVDYWRRRNDFISRAREMYLGRNAIKGPETTQYRVRVMHTRMLTAAVAEKKARYLPLPEIQIVPMASGPRAQAKASRLELALNAAMQQLESNSHGVVWDRLVEDAIYLDAGVERIERAPAAFWPELVIRDDDGKTVLERLFEGRPDEEFQEGVREYKKRAGLPLRAVYVPLERFYPYYEGPLIIEAFEIELRPLRSVISNRSFSPEARAALAQYAGEDVWNDTRTQVAIVHYCNQYVYSYYAVLPARANERVWPLTTDMYGLEAAGPLMLLHSYEHKLGRVLYNVVPGRYGGWSGATNNIEAVIDALIELNQVADEVASQFLTNVRAKYWPNLKFVVNPEYRPPDEGRPVAPVLREGEPLVLFSGEEVSPIFEPAADPAAQWLYSLINQQFHRLAGSPVVYGERERGVETGYLQNLQLTQAEHLDTKLEHHLVRGAINRVELMLLHIRAMGEPVYVGYSDMSEEGRRYTKYEEIRPEDIYPLPRMDARVRKQRPLDFMAAIRAALDASAPRRGPGTPLLPDDVIYEEILGLGQPDLIKKKIWIQSEQDRLLASGVLAERVARRLGLARMDAPRGFSAQLLQEADPALVEALRQKLQEVEARELGGVSPEVVEGLMGQPPQRPGDIPAPSRQGGWVRGQPQPEAVQGLEIAKAVMRRG